MPHTPNTPYAWTMQDPAVLAHRFTVPELLAPYTALTVAPGQSGLVFIDDQVHRCTDAGIYQLTDSLVRTIEEAEALRRACSEVPMTYNAQLILFDVRQKLHPAQTISLTAANQERVTASLSLTYCVDNPEKLHSCGANYQPCEGGLELRADDPRIAEAFRRAVDEAAEHLSRQAAGMDDARSVEAMLTNARLRTELRGMADGHLLPLGLRLTAAYLSPARTFCPYCRKQLSLTEIRRRFCSAVDDDGKPQSGCGKPLHVCPSCDTIVGAEHPICPTCSQELLFCSSPGCNTYRLVERGRFCPVCKRACYPLPDREFLTLS